jgi:hypothetical protein
MGAARPCSPARSPSTNGTPSLATRHMPTPSSTGSFTTPIVSTLPATASGADAPDQFQRIDHRPATCQNPASRVPASQATSSRIAGRDHLGISGQLRRNLHGPLFRHEPRGRSGHGGTESLVDAAAPWTAPDLLSHVLAPGRGSLRARHRGPRSPSARRPGAASPASSRHGDRS